MNQDPITDPREGRILVLAPARKDAATVSAILDRAGFATSICADIAALASALQQGAGALLVAEEVLAAGPAKAALAASLDRQPPWSDLPVIVVTARATGHSALRAEQFADLGNVILLERPLRSATIVSAMRSALRARRRQYQVRDHLIERQHAEERLRAQERELRRLAEMLEERVKARTSELVETNRKLTLEMQQREQAEQALRHAQKMEAIGQLTGGVAHDFNNLLMVFSSGLTLLERTTDKDRRDRIVASIRQAVARGEALTRQLLAFSRHMVLSPEPTDLRALLDGMRILVGGALGAGIDIDIDVAEDIWPVMADPAHLELAILNMAVNARDAMPEGGSLKITASNCELHGTAAGGLVGNFVRLEISDTGTGIPPELLDRIFDPFFTTKPMGKGTGLGLSQVYGFARQSGGHVAVRSRLGEGTTLVLHLPKTSSLHPEAHERPGDRADPPRLAESGLRAMVVEDDNEVATLTASMLEGLGFAVNHVVNGPAALAALESGLAVDLVLSDIVMPGGMNGFELARELKRRHPALPVILATGYADEARDGQAVEGVRVLRKPYRLEALEAALREVCDGGGTPCQLPANTPSTL